MLNPLVSQVPDLLMMAQSSTKDFTVFITIIVLAVVFLFAIVMIWASRYRKCPSDRIMVIYGKTGQGAAKCIHGGATFVWPVIQDYGFLSLRPMQIEVSLTNALSKQNIRVNVPSIFTVAVTTDPQIMKNAAERLFGQSPDAIAGLAKDIAFGQLRLVVSALTIEEINSDRENFLREVEKNVAGELNKIGLQLLNVNIVDITDESGYIDAIGKRAAAEAINSAKIAVAEEERRGGIGQAEARKEQRIKVAYLETEAQTGEAQTERDRHVAIKQAEAMAASGEAEAERDRRITVKQAEATAISGEAAAVRDQRIAVKQADARAVEGENISAIEIAKSNATRAEQEAEAYRRGEAANRVADAMIHKAQYEADQQAQLARAELEKARQQAEFIVTAEIEKQKVEIAAEAEAEKRRREARGEADAIFMKFDAEARGNFEILKAKANGFNAIISGCANDSNAAAKLLLIEKLEELVSLQAEAIKNIKIDKVTVWDSGSGKDGKTSTANFLSGMVKSLPALHDVAGMAGIDLPKYMGEVTADKTESQKEEGAGA